MVIRLLSLIVLGLLAAATLFLIHSRHGAVHASGPPVPVLVELFTSEGCSSCPPADELLAKLDRDQSIQGAHLIVLGEHVDYWDRQGWKDRFSSPVFIQRQTAYAEHLGLESAYTPQAVVNGRTELVASDSAKLRRAAVDNSHPAQVEITLDQEVGSLNVHTQTRGSSGGDAHLFLAVTQTGATTQVKSGENGGKTLHHAPVVLQFRDLGEIRNNSGDRRWPIDDSLRGKSGLRAVAFVQDAKTFAVLGASQIDLQ